MESEERSIIDEIRESRIYVELSRFPEDQRQDLRDFLDGKEVVIEHQLRYGKIICHFIPTSADEKVKQDIRRQVTGEPVIVYQFGVTDKRVRDEQITKRIQAGTSADELLNDFIERERFKGLTFYEPIATLTQPYYFSEELKRLLPDFLEQIVEKLDIFRICSHLDEYQTLNVPPDMAAQVAEWKKLLAEDFLAKHSNEKELRRVLKIKHGGARRRKGFVWTNQRKISLYKRVESLPKVKGKTLWHFILDELIEHEFDAETISWLKTRPALKEIPDVVLKDALRTWRKYVPDENWDEMKRQDKPRAFAFRHALYLLDYPDEFAYSTLETYCSEGKRLFEKQL